MPVYAYECIECGMPFETYRPVEQRDDVECPQCSLPVRRLISQVQIQTPDHFQMKRGWHLPQTREQHENLEKTIDQMNQPKEEGYREFVERRLAEDRKITLGAG